MKKRRRSQFHAWIALSLVIHVGLLLLPSHLFEPLFPPAKPSGGAIPRDLTPNFAEIAIRVVPLAEEAAILAIEPMTSLEEELPMDMTVQGGSPHAESPPTQVSTLAQQFYPPLPRFIVPPVLEDLDISSVQTSIKIFVGTSGQPERIMIPDSLKTHEIGRRIIEAAARFRFQPARLGDDPVSAWIELPLTLESSRSK